ncbi:unnamed protein product, partial [Pylaiella littoralis]
MTASYEVLKEFMEQEEANRRTTARPGDGYVDFRDTMTLVDDGNERFVWVRNENVPKWRETRPLPASGPPPQAVGWKSAGNQLSKEGCSGTDQLN